MISSILVLSLATAAARAALVPTAPGPGQVYRANEECPISWDLDTSGKWTSFNIDLMSGSNTVMTTVTNVFKGRDGTKGETTYHWKCPQVTPNSGIYFYQFTQAGADTTWTTRFTIASASEEVTPPANPTQPGGAQIPWGVGHLAGAATSTVNETTATPSAGSNSGTNVTSTNATSSVLVGGSNSTATNTTSGTDMSSPPKQSTSKPSSSTPPPSTKGSSATNTASTVNANKPASSASDAPTLMLSKVGLTTLAFITLSLAA